MGWNQLDAATRRPAARRARRTARLRVFRAQLRGADRRRTRAASPTTACRSPPSSREATSSARSFTPSARPGRRARARQFSEDLADPDDHELIPAIDLRGGRCVRLLQGRFRRARRAMTSIPSSSLVRYRDAGARWLHVVDLDGAKAGRPQNLPLGRADRRDAWRCSIQLGGGIRTHATVVEALSIGGARVVVGSLAVDEARPRRRLARRARRASGSRSRSTCGSTQTARHACATHGWTQASAVTLCERRRALSAARPAARALHRHRSRRRIERARTSTLYAECVRRWPAIALQASGGVRDAARSRGARAPSASRPPCRGKALLEGTLTPEEMTPFLPAA